MAAAESHECSPPKRARQEKSAKDAFFEEINDTLEEEVLNVVQDDDVVSNFNFKNAWVTGWNISDGLAYFSTVTFHKRKVGINYGVSKDRHLWIYLWSLWKGGPKIIFSPTKNVVTTGTGLDFIFFSCILDKFEILKRTTKCILDAMDVLSTKDSKYVELPGFFSICHTLLKLSGPPPEIDAIIDIGGGKYPLKNENYEIKPE